MKAPTTDAALRVSPPAIPPVVPVPAETTAAQHFQPEAKSSRSLSRRKVIATLAGGVVAAGMLFAVDPNLRRLFGPATSSPVSQGNMGHTGHVIGNTHLPVNSAMSFDSPITGKLSLLIHLPNGQFVAYDRACTHEGVAVNYNSTTHTLICPAHGAVFDPANGAKVLQGPALTSLMRMIIHVNADGTITTA